MTQLSAFVQVAGQGARHHAADPGAHPLHGAGGDQHRQAMGGNSYQRRQHKNRHPDEDHRAATDAVGERAVEQL